MFTNSAVCLDFVGWKLGEKIAILLGDTMLSEKREKVPVKRKLAKKGDCAMAS